MRFALLALTLLSVSIPALSQPGTGNGICIPTKTYDCKGGFWPGGGKDQCYWMDDLVCQVFEDPKRMCYGVMNPYGCVDGPPAAHFVRPIRRPN